MVFFLSRQKLRYLAGLALLALTLTVAMHLLQTEPTRKVFSYLVSINRKVPIYSVACEDKRIALSFDAAWGADETDKLLEILEEYNVKTTFFLVAFWVEKYPEVAQRITAAGHEIGNHSATHPHMSQLTREQIRKELGQTHNLIKEASGQEANLFRPPFGEYNNLLLETAEEMGYRTIQWSVDSLDWQSTTPAAITRRVTERIKPGAIVLFHNNGEHTAAALAPILDFCRLEGYEVVPISELLIDGDHYIDRSSGIMYPK